MLKSKEWLTAEGLKARQLTAKHFVLKLCRPPCPPKRRSVYEAADVLLIRRQLDDYDLDIESRLRLLENDAYTTFGLLASGKIAVLIDVSQRLSPVASIMEYKQDLLDLFETQLSSIDALSRICAFDNRLHVCSQRSDGKSQTFRDFVEAHTFERTERNLVSGVDWLENIASEITTICLILTGLPENTDIVLDKLKVLVAQQSHVSFNCVAYRCSSYELQVFLQAVADLSPGGTFHLCDEFRSKDSLWLNTDYKLLVEEQEELRRLEAFIDDLSLGTMSEKFLSEVEKTNIELLQAVCCKEHSTTPIMQILELPVLFETLRFDDTPKRLLNDDLTSVQWLKLYSVQSQKLAFQEALGAAAATTLEEYVLEQRRTTKLRHSHDVATVIAQKLAVESKGLYFSHDGAKLQKCRRAEAREIRKNLSPENPDVLPAVEVATSKLPWLKEQRSAQTVTPLSDFDVLSIRAYQSRLMSAINAFDDRIEWLCEGFRVHFGSVAESEVALIVDLSSLTIDAHESVSQHLKETLEAQIAMKYGFTLILCSAGEAVDFTTALDPTEQMGVFLKPTEPVLNEAYRWYLSYVCSGKRNLAAAVKRLTTAIERDAEAPADRPPIGVYAYLTTPLKSNEIDASQEAINALSEPHKLRMNLILNQTESCGHFEQSVDEDLLEIFAMKEFCRANGGRYFSFNENGIVNNDDVEQIMIEKELAKRHYEKASFLVESTERKYPTIVDAEPAHDSGIDSQEDARSHFANFPIEAEPRFYESARSTAQQPLIESRIVVAGGQGAYHQRCFHEETTSGEVVRKKRRKLRKRKTTAPNKLAAVGRAVETPLNRPRFKRGSTELTRKRLEKMAIGGKRPSAIRAEPKATRPKIDSKEAANKAAAARAAFRSSRLIAERAIATVPGLTRPRRTLSTAPSGGLAKASNDVASEDADVGASGDGAELRLSRNWLRTYGLVALKLDLLGFARQFTVCKHEIATLNNNTEPFCTVYPSIVIGDKVCHVPLSVAKVGSLIAKLDVAIESYLTRIRWLLSSASLKTFGAIDVRHNQIVLVDLSSSLGANVKQVASLLSALVLEQMAPFDVKFNVIAFSTRVDRFRRQLVEAGQTTADQLREWLTSIDLGPPAIADVPVQSKVLDAFRAACMTAGVSNIVFVSDQRPAVFDLAIFFDRLRAMINDHRLCIDAIALNCKTREDIDFLRQLAREAGGRFVCANEAWSPMVDEVLPDDEHEFFKSTAKAAFESDDVRLIVEELTRARQYRDRLAAMKFVIPRAL